ncbi:MAG TPA: DUF4194 domain-containing protein [Chlorobaculum parvum]|uniref:DUF4194 domain-containing protein n=1 Tax=Chlorobaculum parvum TaxID=274539 RepID=A0A7C5DFZ8_9CHLB|nr:DUF4194 domain-containing protein [Chlorobaculum parvum]
MNPTDIETPQPPNTPQELSQLLVALLKGVLYQDENTALWSALLNLQAGVRDYVAVIGLELTLDEAKGYAFLRSRPAEDEQKGEAMPRLVARRQLSYPVSLLLALLRKKLAEADASGGETRLILSRDEVAELVRIFLPAGSNEAKLIDQVDATLNKIADLGFIRRLRSSPPPPGRTASLGVRSTTASSAATTSHRKSGSTRWMMLSRSSASAATPKSSRT